MKIINITWLYVMAGVLFSSFAQISVKYATTLTHKSLIWKFFLLISIAFYCISFVSYYMSLKYFPISKVGPVMTIGVILLVVSYGLYSGEQVSWKNILGLFLGVLSISLILS